MQWKLAQLRAAPAGVTGGRHYSLGFHLFPAKRELTQMDQAGAGQAFFTGDALPRKLYKPPGQFSPSDILTDS